jgi:putative nucleotidyltransferase with HDIG domain
VPGKPVNLFYFMPIGVFTILLYLGITGMLKKIDTRLLRIGMYVSELDRPWTETSFLFQGLLIESAQDIDQIQELCSYVYIDSEDQPDTGNVIREFGIHTEGKRAGIDEILSDFPRDYSYPVILPVERELESANQAYNAAASVFCSIWNRVRSSKGFSSSEFKPTIQKITSSVIRNPDAFLMLRTLCDDRDYNCRHAINSCALAAVFGRHLGLYPDDISVLATGAFLLDIGKARLPEELLNKRGPLTLDERQLFQCHATVGVEILSEVDGLPAAVIDMVKSHHERDNGGGYPTGLDGNQIPVVARIAALIDCFDAITIDRPYKSPLAAVDALKMVMEAVDVDFQKQFVEEFSRCLGPYPTGAVVELSNDCVAAVIEQNPKNRKQPRVMLLSSGGKPLEDRHIVIDLCRQPAAASRNSLEIRSLLSTGMGGGKLKNRMLAIAS